MISSTISSNKNGILFSFTFSSVVGRNTLIAEVDGQPAGMITAYDGQYYRDWRHKTFELAAQVWSNTFPDMEDEAVAGEYYHTYWKWKIDGQS